MIIKEEDYLEHIGTLHKSGRYPWGSGDNPHQRNQRLIDNIAEFHKQGLTDTEIAKGLGMKRSELQAQKSIAKNEEKQADINMAVRLAEKGYSNVAIGERMGINESSVRSLRNPSQKLKADMLMATANRVRSAVDTKGFVDVGLGVEHHVGVSRDKLDIAIALLKEKGYAVHVVQIDQLGTTQKTYTKVIAPPGTTYPDIAGHKDLIRSFTDITDDGGLSWSGLQPPISIDSNRINVLYAKDGGGEADGVIHVRPGIEELSLGADHYAQVRIAVDGSHYLKGMGMYKDNLPKGVDLQFNTNKIDKTGNKLDAMKLLVRDNDGNIDQANPFGSLVRQLPQLDENGKEISNTVRSAMNIVNTEGKWSEWSKNLSPQMLSKQSPSLAKDQLNMTYEKKKVDLNEILSLTNPGVRIKLLETFAKSVDSSSVHLKAAALPRQSTHVILPVGSMKKTEIYAPTFRNGERVVLIRFPHGGIFEIPELTVNNRQSEAKELLGNAPDAIGINAVVAERLSGADFDGDTVLVIPNNKDLVKIAPALEHLKNFDPKVEYPEYEGMLPMTPENKGLQMGDVSNLITDMTLKGAPFSDIAKAVRHSMVVIDAEKHNLNYKQSAKDNGIAKLKEKYQGGLIGPGGASTLISARKGRLYVPEYKAGRAKDGGPINKQTGQLINVPTGKSYKETLITIDPATGKKIYTETGNMIPNRTRTKRLAWATDAHTLSSGTKMENIYADHSNKLKALANTARKEMVNTKTSPISDSAKAVYSNEVASLNAKLSVAQYNSPLERLSQIIAKSAVSSVKASNAYMDKADLKKISFLALETARIKTGAKKQAIELTDSEWKAIQAGAISNNKLTMILNNANLDQIKMLATPRTQLAMTATKKSRALTLLARGYTQAEVADQLGVSISTLATSLKGVG